MRGHTKAVAIIAGIAGLLAVILPIRSGLELTDDIFDNSREERNNAEA
jgi:hypothetical protein